MEVLRECLKYVRFAVKDNKAETRLATPIVNIEELGEQTFKKLK